MTEHPTPASRPLPSAVGNPTPGHGTPLRLGVLGAARIAELAIVGPAHATNTRLVAIAARDPGRAAAFAAEHGVERVVESYTDLVNDPEVEAVYNPLPNALHGPWNLAAVSAGKHVLSEKPFASNASEALVVWQAAAAAGVVVAQAFHYLFHPLTKRLHALLDSGELGSLLRVEARMDTTAPAPGDPRWSWDMAGGALMDLGCYALHATRMLAPWGGGEPRLLRSRGGERAGCPGVDEWLDADLQFPSGATASATCNMAAPARSFHLRVIGSIGIAEAFNFVQPHLDDRLLVTTAAGRRTEHLGTRPSYDYQLQGFIDHLRSGTPLPFPVDDPVTSMQLIDDCYLAAGFALRPQQPATMAR